MLPKTERRLVIEAVYLRAPVSREVEPSEGYLSHDLIEVPIQPIHRLQLKRSIEND